MVFVAYRYASNPSLYAVELINEPLSPGVSLDVLTKYYRAGYDTVRKHSSSAYVVMSNRLGPANPTELFPFASGLTGSVIDVHYYNLFSDTFNNLSVQQNIDFVYTNRSAQLNQITTANGPLTFVGMYENVFVSASSYVTFKNFHAKILHCYIIRLYRLYYFLIRSTFIVLLAILKVYVIWN